MDWIFERSAYHVEECLAECEDAITRLGMHQTSSSTTRTKLASLARSMSVFKHRRSLAPNSVLQKALNDATVCIEYLQQPRDYLGMFCLYFVGRRPTRADDRIDQSYQVRLVLVVSALRSGNSQIGLALLQ